jgi:hypothetical protein
MGQEPWLNHVMSLNYTPNRDDHGIEPVESRVARIMGVRRKTLW